MENLILDKRKVEKGSNREVESKVEGRKGCRVDQCKFINLSRSLKVMEVVTR